MDETTTEQTEAPAAEAPVDPQAKWARRIVGTLANVSFVLAIVLDLWWFDTWLWRGVMLVPMLAFTFFVLFGMGYLPVRLFAYYRRKRRRRARRNPPPS